MALTNALLVRWAQGFTWVTDAGSIATHGRREAFLSLGSAGSLTEVQAVATAHFAEYGQPRLEVAAALEPTGSGDAPYVNFNVADTVTVPSETGSAISMRVMALTVTEDGEGNPMFVPELGRVAESSERTMGRWLKRMSAGTLSGTSESATPAGATKVPVVVGGREATTDAPPFEIAGAVVIGESTKWPPRRSIRVYRLYATLKTSGTTTTTVVLKKNGTIVATLNLASGALSGGVDCSVTVAGPEADNLTLATTAAGAGAIGLNAQLAYS